MAGPRPGRVRRRSGPSTGFLAAIAGVGMTLLSWYGPWTWPGWPAYGVMAVVWGGQSGFSDLGNGERSVAMVVLITVNVAVWGAIAGAAALWLRAALRGSPRPQ